MTDIFKLDATAQAAMVAAGDVSASELLEAAIVRADASHAKLNAIVVRFDGKARAQAKTPLAGPFAGVPFLLKDLAQEYAGEICSRGTASLAHKKAVAHSAYTRRCLDAGLVIFGRTATPEFGLRAQTESKLWGPSRNPWEPSRTPGGSSGGSAAAVAAGVVPMAGANDGGGSIRIPAAFCGLFGLKPSTGRVSWGPGGGEEWEGASANGVLTRSVRDTAAMLDVLAGAEPGDPFEVALPARPYVQEVGVPPGRLRIGFSVKAPMGGAVDPACVAAVQNAAKLLESLGHHVEEAEPVIDGKALGRAFLTMYLGQVAADVASTGAPDSAFELETGLLAWLGRALPAGEYVTALRQWNGYARALGAFHQTYDLLLTPTVAAPPALIGELALPRAQQILLPILAKLPLGRVMLKAGLLEQVAEDSLARTPFTQLSNMTGTASMSVPLHWQAAGTGGVALPVGVQFVGKWGSEALLVRLAAQLEQAAPWADKWPEMG